MGARNNLERALKMTSVVRLQIIVRSFSLNGTNFTPLDLVQPSRRCKNVASPFKLAA